MHIIFLKKGFKNEKNCSIFHYMKMKKDFPMPGEIKLNRACYGLFRCDCIIMSSFWIMFLMYCICTSCTWSKFSLLTKKKLDILLIALQTFSVKNAPIKDNKDVYIVHNRVITRWLYHPMIGRMIGMSFAFLQILL